jgi:hypothetical protein
MISEPMSKYNLLLFLVLIGLFTGGCGYRSIFLDLPPNNRITVANEDFVYNFTVHQSNNTLNTDLRKMYYYYHGSNLKFTQGAYLGKLVHGAYFKVDRNGHLMEKGKFEYGLKVGSWLEWHTNGFLKSETYYRNGEKRRAFYEYYPDGNLRKKGRYRRDQLHGKVTVYEKDGGKVIERYRRGQLVKQKEKVKRKIRKKREEEEEILKKLNSREKDKLPSNESTSFHEHVSEESLEDNSEKKKKGFKLFHKKVGRKNNQRFLREKRKIH